MRSALLLGRPCSAGADFDGGGKGGREKENGGRAGPVAMGALCLRRIFLAAIA